MLPEEGAGQMPREGRLDQSQIIDKASDIFAAKGFGGTSMEEISKATGIETRKLYDIFGSKTGLFKQALLRFERNQQQLADDELEAHDDPVGAIAFVIDTIVAQSSTPGSRKGNLVVATALELQSHDADIREIARSAVSKLEQFFRRMILLGQERGSIPSGISPPDAAKTLTALAVGVRVLACGTFRSDEFDPIREGAMGVIGL